MWLLTSLFDEMWEATKRWRTASNYLYDPLVIGWTFMVIELLWMIIDTDYHIGSPLAPLFIYGFLIIISNSKSMYETKEVIPVPKEVPQVATVKQAIAATANFVYTPTPEENELESRLAKLAKEINPTTTSPILIPDAGQFVFQLLFRSQEARQMIATSERNAIELSNLSDYDREDLIGVERI